MAQRKSKKDRRISFWPIAVFALLVFTQLVLVSAQEETFEEIMRPLQTIYDLVKYAATIIAGLVLLFAGISYMMNGSDPKKREHAKNMVMYVIIGLIVIWAAPFVVDLVLGG